jgi:type II secretory ATPase GspE/PulE/Tfp pilus assembly ATPase PilB-like protein
LITEKAPESAFREHYSQKKFITLQEAAFRKIISGISSVEEFLRLTKN